MTPPCYTFPAAELVERVQLDVHGRQRKMPYDAASPSDSSSSRHRDINLARDCALLSSMVQYTCAVVHPETPGSPVRCWPVQRLFRRCRDRHGTFMVETTAWEADYAGAGQSVGRVDDALETAARTAADPALALPTGAAASVPAASVPAASAPASASPPPAAPPPAPTKPAKEPRTCCVIG